MLIEERKTNTNSSYKLLFGDPTLGELMSRINSANIGLGYAMYIGLKKAVSFKTDFICSIDSDGQVDLKEIEIFYDEIKKGNHQLILGSRFLRKDLIEYDYKLLNCLYIFAFYDTLKYSSCFKVIIFFLI